jgi:hypothetical protein
MADKCPALGGSVLIGNRLCSVATGLWPVRQAPLPVDGPQGRGYSIRGLGARDMRACGGPSECSVAESAAMERWRPRPARWRYGPLFLGKKYLFSGAFPDNSPAFLTLGFDCIGIGSPLGDGRTVFV